MRRPRSIAVIGAGLLGLSTAYLALKDGYLVKIYSAEPSDKTTSMIAGASFKLYKTEVFTNIEQMIKDTWDEYKRHEDLAGKTPRSGVRLGRHMVASMKPLLEPDMRHLVAVEDTRRYPQDDPSYKIPGGYKYGISYTTFHINPFVFIPYLVSKIEKMGGVFEQRFFSDENEFGGLTQDIIVNCTGLGARELSKDKNMKPVKGQLVAVNYSEKKLKKALGDLDSISADGRYIYPHPEEKLAGGIIKILLGGTTEETENMMPDADITRSILEGNGKILSGLQEKKSLAGLRPYRTGGAKIGVRNVGKKTVIDNYGHGGSGYTLCWGSAKRALSLISLE